MNEEEIIQELGYISTNVDEKGERAIHAFVDLYNQEKEKNKKLEEEWDESIINAYFNKEEVCNKVIDMMAEDIADNNISEDICRQFKMKDSCYKDNTYDDTECRECVKQYYFKKARGESNE